MDVERVVPEEKTGAGHPIALYIIIVIVIIILLLIIFGNYIFKPSNHYGTWSTPIAGPCIRSTPDCQGPGYQDYISVCIPNSVTSQGCPDENGIPTYAPKIWRESCTPVCQYSVWNVSKSGCIANSDPSSDEGTSTTTYTCVQKDSTGRNDCMRIVTKVESTGTFHEPIFYNVGESYSIEFPCNPQTEFNGAWMAGTVNSDGTVNGDTFTATPILGGNYQLSENCETQGQVLKEDMAYLPMTCVSYDREKNIYTVLPESECPPTVTTCYSYLPTLENDPNSRAIICPGVISDIPHYAYPCRYRPVQKIDYGSPDIDVVSNHYVLATLGTSIFLPGQAPNNLYTYVPLSDQGTPQDSKLQSVPMVITNQEINGCTLEEINFNSGAFLYFAVREVINQDQFIGIVGAYVAGRYQGWLQVRTSETGENYLMWEQGQLAFTAQGSPGILSTDASLILVTLSNRDPTPVSGYPTNVGSIEMSLTTTAGDPLYCHTLNLDGYILLDNLTSILLPVTTDICSAALRGDGACSMYSIISGVYTQPNCSK